MSSSFGRTVTVTVYGRSHEERVGASATGFPAGEAVDTERLLRFLDRRRPGRSALSTSRNETDRPVFLSGLKDGVTDGDVLDVVMENADVRSGDYEATVRLPRPGHADYPAWLRWNGREDMRGGGQFSARLTAPLCALGGIALQILERRGIRIGGHIASVASVPDDPFPLFPDDKLLDDLAGKEFPVLNDDAGNAMKDAILQAKADGDSVGGVVECAVTGLPGGLGGPRFDGADARIAAALFGIPAVKGVEFGSGFGAAGLRGSENNDSYEIAGGKISAASNHAGGILGGITYGMPIVVRAVFKPTPSVSVPQQTVDLEAMRPAVLTLTGRHDPCVVPRAVPVVEAVTALAVLDMLLEG